MASGKVGLAVWRDAGLVEQAFGPKETAATCPNALCPRSPQGGGGGEVAHEGKSGEGKRENLKKKGKVQCTEQRRAGK